MGLLQAYRIEVSDNFNSICLKKTHGRNIAYFFGFLTYFHTMSLRLQSIYHLFIIMLIQQVLHLIKNALKSSHFSHSKCYKNRIY